MSPAQQTFIHIDKHCTRYSYLCKLYGNRNLCEATCQVCSNLEHLVNIDYDTILLLELKCIYDRQCRQLADDKCSKKLGNPEEKEKREWQGQVFTQPHLADQEGLPGSVVTVLLASSSKREKEEEEKEGKSRRRRGRLRRESHTKQPNLIILEPLSSYSVLLISVEHQVSILQIKSRHLYVARLTLLSKQLYSAD